MAERKLRPAPSQLISLATRSAPRTEKSGTRGPAASPDLQKLFVLDTNVLMHDPTSLFRFEEHDIYLPMFVLEELDAHKKGVTEVARNARQASRFLDELVTLHAAGTEHEGIAQASRSARSPTAPPPAACTCRPRRSRSHCRPRSPTARPTTRSWPS
jgi:PhoH-like ATPase